MAKFKVYELAKELEKQSKEIISFLQEKGIEVKAAQSGVDDEAAEMVRKHFGAAKEEKKEEAKASEQVNEVPVKVEGGKNLEIGNNEVLITVTAENGSQRVYTVHITRAEYVAEPTAAPDIPDNPAVPTETPSEPVLTLKPGILFGTKEEQVLLTEYHTYTPCEKPESITLPDGYVQTTLMINERQVEAYAKQGENPEEFLLLVLKNDAGEVNLYRYDRVEQTLQRVKEEEYVITQVIESNDEGLKEAVAEYQVYQSILTFAVAFLTGVCLVLLLVILWLCIRHKNRG